MPDSLPGDNALAGASTPTIYNVTLTLADTEYPQTLPRNCRKFSIRPRTSSHVIKMSYTANQSGTNYLTMDSSGFLYNDLIGASSLTLYFQSASAGAIVELEAWA